MLKMSDTPIRGFLPFFANAGLQVAFLVPTPTGYQKSIMDATLPLREMFREERFRLRQTRECAERTLWSERQGKEGTGQGL